MEGVYQVLPRFGSGVYHFPFDFFVSFCFLLLSRPRWVGFGTHSLDALPSAQLMDG